MNQILDFGEDKESGEINVIDKDNTQGVFSDEKSIKKVRNANLAAKQSKPKKENMQDNMGYGNNPNKANKAVKIFAILLLIIAIITLFVAGYIILNKDKQSAGESKKTIPEIIVIDNGDTLQVTAKHDKVLEQLVYGWGIVELETPISGEGQNTITTTIEKPFGNNKLQIKVTDIEGNVAVFEETYLHEKGPDLEKPTIVMRITNEKKLHIHVKDNVELRSVKYFWNDEEPRESMESIGKKETEFFLEIPVGNNNITVIAEDTSKNVETKKESYEGKEKPEINIQLTQDRKKVIVKAKHKQGIKKVTCDLNGKQSFQVYEGDRIKKEVALEIKLDPGDNIVKLVIESTDGSKVDYIGRAVAPNETIPPVLNTNTESNANTNTNTNTEGNTNTN